MALTGIYNSSDREIVLSTSQAQVFNQTIQYFKTNGVGGDNVFEDTYVLQKRVAEYIKENVGENAPVNSTVVTQIYDGVLGLTPQQPATSPPVSGIAAVGPAPIAPAQVSAPASPFVTPGGVGGSIGGRNFGGETI